MICYTDLRTGQSMINYVDFHTGKTMVCLMHESVFSGLISATLLGGEFDNCHGQGTTEAQAIISLKIKVNQRRGLYRRATV